MTNGMLSPISPKEARMKNPLVLAYVGDTVFDLYIRTHKVKGSNEHVNPLNRQVCGIVNARSQAAFADRLAAWMDEEEADIFRR
ncbi:MAG: ribonuclease III, partial [Christensenellaceae bacterium]|nr:ribonuclease III [Christensenellaceae bacterium]